ncbi:hypothetical protein [Moorena sp. SIO3B2]|uniref:hypothetical protein n=1 Tax=Moorena sp. SIO3B2 TaxID=2607827 RepID=UPI0013CDC889|nr:hypothetical protein [Moorena sp. SIO3B2]NEP30156.1 hypothetical protein [Moorena sp. SIO3B2]
MVEREQGAGSREQGAEDVLSFTSTAIKDQPKTEAEKNLFKNYNQLYYNLSLKNLAEVFKEKILK